MENKIFVASGLAKIFPEQKPKKLSDFPISMLKNDRAVFQVAVFIDPTPNYAREEISITVKSPIAEMVTVRKVELVPSMLSSFGNKDGAALTIMPSLFPDLLRPLQNDRCFLLKGSWNALWVEIESPMDCATGEFPIAIDLTRSNGETMSAEVFVKLIDAVLPPQKLIHTEWFHGDCLADYYHTDVFSEYHWRLMEDQIRCAAKRSVNMILTPIFTPPLDTEKGGERTTIQLVDVVLEKGTYSFGFEKLERWVRMCQKCGIIYFEMAHLYTQWGAEYCPKIMATTDGKLKKIFGWENRSTSEEYKTFLDAFLPALIEKLTQLGIKDKTIFHISDEPEKKKIASYQAAKDQVKEQLRDFSMMDALSDYDFYEQGICTHPVVATDQVKPFLEGKTPDPFWVYYCCSQWAEVSNRFMSLPSSHNRIIGTQFYKYQVAGFLHWGYNFYNSQFSKRPINPFYVTDAEMGFPSGDAFLVYPGDDGKPWESIRIVVLDQALHDLRALELLESLTSREHVLSLVEEGLPQELTFFSYPSEEEYLLHLREKIHREIEKSSSK